MPYWSENVTWSLAKRPSESNSSLTWTSPAGSGTRAAENSQLTENSPGEEDQLLSFRYHEVSVVNGLFVFARLILRISVPFNDSAFGPLLSTVPLR